MITILCKDQYFEFIKQSIACDLISIIFKCRRFAGEGYSR